MTENTYSKIFYQCEQKLYLYLDNLDPIDKLFQSKTPGPFDFQKFSNSSPKNFGMRFIATLYCQGGKWDVQIIQK